MKQTIKSLSVVIPVFNEIKTLSSVLDAVRSSECGLEKEIIVVDDCSRDGTRSLLEGDLAKAADKTGTEQYMEGL